MTTPTYCSDCGHQLGVGRFCTNCGRPVPGRHPEAAPPFGAPTAVPPATDAATAAPPPVEPPPVGPLPPAPRFPLYAEEQPRRTADVTAPASSTVVRPPQPPSYVAPPPYSPPEPRRRGLLPWLIVLLLVGLVAGLGTVLALNSGDDDDRASDSSSQAADDDTGSDRTNDTEQPDEPDQDGTDGPVPAPSPDDVIDLTANVSATVPGTAPASRDRRNKPVRFDARNMWDTKPRTAWRMAGDATGSTLTFELGQEAVITRVGMINGYTKKDGPVNWYHGNRRVLSVQWEFDDGTRITQSLRNREGMQLIDVGPVRSQTIRLHLLEVSKPGAGPNGRDYTAISEVRFLGAPD